MACSSQRWTGVMEVESEEEAGSEVEVMMMRRGCC